GWTSPAPSIATVTTSGRVRAVDNGTARIRAQSGTLQDSLTVTVEQQAKRVVIAPDPVPPITALGDQQSLTASAFDSLGFLVVAPNKTPGWATLDPTVVTVDRTGLATGVGAGVGRVVAVVDAARDTAPITVGDLAASVVVQPKTATLASLKDTLRLTVTVRNSRGNVIQNPARSEEHTSELQSRSELVCRLLLEKKKNSKSFFATPACADQPKQYSGDFPAPAILYANPA